MSRKKFEELPNLLMEFHTLKLSKILTVEEMQSLTAPQAVDKIYIHLRQLHKESDGDELDEGNEPRAFGLLPPLNLENIDRSIVYGPGDEPYTEYYKRVHGLDID